MVTAPGGRMYSTACETISRGCCTGLVTPLLDPLGDLPAGVHVVQLACGTGGLAIANVEFRPHRLGTGGYRLPATARLLTAHR
ncbi:hypothetical protein [Catenuloplanes indicus]|uniref:Uncharacterized protein n=1 Tax=Catenuloplanes indicus TaxID=137267 RepID=A0AAE3W9T6_9ACTN|nr:hypothetical protein [Catenuloplanes indicus]MDQ0371107.1 hypothetical protein [Catenuloplanes indicus]